MKLLSYLSSFFKKRLFIHKDDPQEDISNEMIHSAYVLAKYKFPVVN